MAVSKAKFYENYKIFLNNLPKEEKAEIKKTMISLDTRIKQFYVTEGERIAKSDYSFEFLALMREVFQFTFPLKKTSKKKKEDLEEEAKIEAQKQEKAQKEYEEWRRREERMKVGLILAFIKLDYEKNFGWFYCFLTKLLGL